MRLIVHSCAKAKKANSTHSGYDDHKHEAELRFVDPMVAVRELDADPIVKGTCDGLADNAEDEG